MSGGYNPSERRCTCASAAEVKGRVQGIHRVFRIGLYALLFVTPWVRIKGDPALLLDIAARRIYVLGEVYALSDSLPLVLLVLGAAFTLFPSSSWFGRLWCGFVCPQTVFREEFIRPIEQFWAGPRGQRMQGDRTRGNLPSMGRKLGKQLSFLAVTLGLSMMTASYFVDPVTLWTGQASLTAYELTGVVGLSLWFDVAWSREQWCKLLCPYAPSQGDRVDDKSLVIEHHAVRSASRMKRRARRAASVVGACTDVNPCVAVCSQGVDIRDGDQLESIHCAPPPLAFTSRVCTTPARCPPRSRTAEPLQRKSDP